MRSGLTLFVFLGLSGAAALRLSRDDPAGSCASLCGPAASCTSLRKSAGATLDPVVVLETAVSSDSITPLRDLTLGDLLTSELTSAGPEGAGAAAA